ncbi:MAG: glycosyltransferase family protein [Magnetospirillum sp.]|nr:glycosyltransferase family protein [Magnetospirillum sp.]
MSDADTASAARARRALAAGAAAWTQGKADQAARSFAEAALLAPQSAVAHGNLGVALRRMGKPQAALISYRRSLALSPDDAAALSNLGNVLRELGRLEEAEAVLSRAVALQPDSVSFAYNLALVVRDRSRHAEALAMMEALAERAPDNGELAWDIALTRLYLCDYARGFAGYEARWRLTRSPPRRFPGPRWEGGPVAGRTVFLHAEQGFGDAIQFARFVPLLAARGARVVLECAPELMELFAGIVGVTAVVARGSTPPRYDLWAPMLSIVHLLGVDWTTPPAEIPYLSPPRRLANPLPSPPGTVLKVGLVWAGKTTPRDRSWPLATLMGLFDDPRVAFWSLQMGPRCDDLAALGVEALVHDAAPTLGSFADTAALMAELDLIVTIDSAPAHLAGALGRPVWMLLRTVSDWRWLDQGETCVWYPGMRLFRQSDPDDYATPARRLAEALRALIPAA